MLTYIIGHYNPTVRIIDLVSYTTYVVCVHFIHKWRGDLQFKVQSEQQIFWETFSWQVYLLSEFLPENCWEDSKAYTQPYSCGERIKLIICQIRYELGVTIHEISTSWKRKTLDGGPSSLVVMANYVCILQNSCF